MQLSQCTYTSIFGYCVYLEETDVGGAVVVVVHGIGVAARLHADYALTTGLVPTVVGANRRDIDY